MPSPNDLANRLKFQVDDVTYLALKHRCASEDRTMSQHLRHLVKVDIATAVDIEKSREGSAEGLE